MMLKFEAQKNERKRRIESTLVDPRVDFWTVGGKGGQTLGDIWLTYVVV